MNDLFKIIFVVICFFFTTLLFSDITIAFAKNSSSYGNKPSPEQLIDIKKIKKIAEERNIKVTFRAIPWKRSLLMLEKGLLDALMNASYKAQRAEYAIYPITNNKLDRTKRLNDGNTYYIYRHVDSTLRWNGEIFTPGGKIGVREKYAVIDDLKKHSNITISQFVKNSQIVRKLSSNEIDGYAASDRETKRLINQYEKFSATIVKEPLPIRKKDYFLIFSKKTYIYKSKEMEEILLGLKKFNTKQ